MSRFDHFTSSRRRCLPLRRLVTGTDGAILYPNPAFERLTGYNCVEVLGQNPRILKSGRHDAAFYRQLWATLGDGLIWQGRFVNKGKNGTFFEEQATRP